ncbi:MAG: glycosyltransferase, partial [Acidimicrobiales bacterium]
MGGLESVVTTLAVGQRRTGVDPHIAAILEGEAPGHAFVGRLEEGGVRVVQVRLGPRAYLAERARVAALCRELQPDVVHTHGYRPDVVDAPVARRLAIPVITTVHGFTGGGWKNRMYEWLDRRALRRFDAVVAVARASVIGLVAAGVPRDRIHVIPNAWDQRGVTLSAAEARRQLGLSGDGWRIGWVGRLSREKAADVMLAAMARLAGEPYWLSIIGDGSERRRLEHASVRLGVAHRTTWHGPVPAAGSRFAAFDVFVLSSRTEGTPVTLFEAMAAGVPIVAAAVGGVPDVVSPAEAILVPPDDPAAIAAGIRQVRAAPAAAASRARAARI